MADYNKPVLPDGAPITGIPKTPGANQSAYVAPKAGQVSTPPKTQSSYFNHNANYKAPPVSVPSTSMNNASYKQTPKMESVDEDDINDTDDLNIDDTDVVQEGIVGAVVATVLLTPVVLTAALVAHGIVQCKIEDHKYRKKLLKELSELTGKKVTNADLKNYNNQADNIFKKFIDDISFSDTANKYFKYLNIENDRQTSLYHALSDITNVDKDSSKDTLVFVSERICCGIIKKSKIDDLSKKLKDVSNDKIKLTCCDEQCDLPGDDNGGDWGLLINAGIVKCGPEDVETDEEMANLMNEAEKALLDYDVISISIMMTATNFFNSIIQETVTKIIKESPDLITALESVGAMYCIPSTHFTCDNTLKSIRVVGDCVNAPDIKNVSGNGKAIMCAIGSVLDYISQRIDTKLDAYHKNNVDSTRHNELEKLTMRSISLPDKIDTYFNDMDDITADMDLNVVDNTFSDKDSVDIASEIQESADIFEMYASHGCTKNLGYDILQEQGFDYVQPTNSIVTESAKMKDESKILTPMDIKYMKFDNKHLLDAVKYFNQARAEQANVNRGRLDIKQFINSPAYIKAVDSISKQFNANIQLRFFSTRNVAETSEFTFIYKDIKSNLSISKAKGFQLNGLPIIICLFNNAIDIDAPDDIELFGQNVVSVILHEIFHNIVGVITETNNEFYAALSTTLSIASSITNGKKKRIFISNYVNTIDNFFGVKMNRFNRRSLVKRLSILSSILYNDKAIKGLRDDISNASSNEEADLLIAQYKKIIDRKLNGNKKTMIVSGIITAVSLITSIAFGIKSTDKDDLFSKISTGATGITALSVLSFGSSLISAGFNKASNKAYKNAKEMEEYYCDLFAAMYNLPVTFLYGLCDGKHAGFTANQIDDKRLNELVKLEKQIYELIWSSYPTTFERNHASVKVAKNILESDDKIDPSIKKYLQWIVDNYSSMLDTNIAEIYNTTTFDPKEAEDLDKHLDNLISNNRITLTESYIKQILASDKHISD